MIGKSSTLQDLEEFFNFQTAISKVNYSWVKMISCYVVPRPGMTLKT